MIYIVLPVHNRKNITEKFIKCLVRQTCQGFKLLLIDDGSSDGTDEMVRQKVSAEKLTVIKGSGSWWWAGSLQQGIDWLKKKNIQSSDIILMINDDVTFKANFLDKGITFIKENPGSLLLSRLYNEENNLVEESGVKADLKNMTFLQAKNSDEINCLSTRGLFMRWDILQRIGDFYPVLLPHYCSDYEFTIRAKKKRVELETVEEVYIKVDYNTTGVHSSEGLLNIREIFSKRYVMNPIYWSVFVILVSPKRWIPKNLIKIWFLTLKMTARKML